jgi:hypothetical protein
MQISGEGMSWWQSKGQGCGTYAVKCVDNSVLASALEESFMEPIGAD